MLLVAFLIKSINQINFYIEELLILLKTCFRNSWFIMKSIGQRDTSFFPIICCLPQTDLYMCQKIWEEPEESMPVSHHMNGNFMHLKGAKRTFVLLLLHHYQQGTYHTWDLGWDAGLHPADRGQILCVFSVEVIWNLMKSRQSLPLVSSILPSSFLPITANNLGTSCEVIGRV